ncbi:TBC1 domain family member 5-like isoform X2 [Limulus polyphemus]|uniref:TBC1 domain family member 5-like isoform X2 n=1 Tax=Limulus polyphemus TaxID=6850 RepID=A0ABM1SKU9_LIMPO|nr:TBC1 domain family member 5-like isoform X2 [Limulus polyphemus]
MDENGEKVKGQKTAASYNDEWEELFGNKFYLEKLRNIGLKGQLRSCVFRSICWRVYLECLSDQRSEWISKARDLRSQYEEIKYKLQLKTNPRHEELKLDLAVNNPLSQELESPWNQFFQDSELKATIKQDVIRTFPEIEFFHTQEIQVMMVDILFSYAREYPAVSYRQGMHELLAPILFVLHSDQQSFLLASEIGYVKEEIRELLNPQFTEHDAFFMFYQVMETVEAWYLTNEDRYVKPTDYFNLAPFSQPPESGPCSTLGVKLTKIHEQLLRRQDPELYCHLTKLEIAPQIFGIRWLRLLFGREFPVQDLLVIWDAIFADSVSFDLVDYLFTAMLVFIRELLLNGDYTSSLNYLMHYPVITDVHCIIELALHLREPLRYNRPVGYACKMLRHTPNVRSQQDIYQTSVKSLSPSLQKLHSPKKELLSSRPKSLVLEEIMPTNTPRKNEKPSVETFNAFKDSVDASSHCVLEKGENSAEKKTFGNRASKQLRHVRHQSDGFAGRLVDMSAETLPKHSKVSYKLDRSGLSLSLGKLSAEDAISSEVMYKEMVPLTQQCLLGNTEPIEYNTSHYSSRKNNINTDEELQALRAQVSEMEAMNNYCCKRMTHHLELLQDCMLKQSLDHEDEMFLAVAGLKRVRDILKGTVNFAEEVTDEEDLDCEGPFNKYEFQSLEKEFKNSESLKFKTSDSCTTSNSAVLINPSSPCNRSDYVSENQLSVYMNSSLASTENKFQKFLPLILSTFQRV